MPLRSPRPLVAFRNRLCRSACGLFVAPAPGHAGRLRSGRQERLPLARRHRLRQQDLHPHGQGRMHFVCSYDTKGFYWRFSHPSGGLYRGNTKVGTLNSDWSITASDGTTLKMSVPERTRRKRRGSDRRRLQGLGPRRGTFAGVCYVERTNTRAECRSPGCSASQQETASFAPLRPTTRSGVDACYEGGITFLLRFSAKIGQIR